MMNEETVKLLEHFDQMKGGKWEQPGIAIPTMLIRIPIMHNYL